MQGFGHLSTTWFRLHATSTSSTAVVTIHVHLRLFAIVNVYLATVAAAARVFAHDMSSPNEVALGVQVVLFFMSQPVVPSPVHSCSNIALEYLAHIVENL